MYTCMCVCMYVCMCMYVFICVCICLNMCIYVYMCVYVYVCVYVCMYMCVCLYPATLFSYLILHIPCRSDPTFNPSIHTLDLTQLNLTLIPSRFINYLCVPSHPYFTSSLLFSYVYIVRQHVNFKQLNKKQLYLYMYSISLSQSQCYLYTGNACLYVFIVTCHFYYSHLQHFISFHS